MMDEKTTVTANQYPADAENKSGVYGYIGPNIRNVIQGGTFWRGTREEVLSNPVVAAAVEKYPLIKTLIVSGDALPEARLKVRQPGNSLYRNYRRLAGKE